MQKNRDYSKGALVLSAFALALIVIFGGILLNRESPDSVDENAIANAVLAGLEFPEYDTEKLNEVWTLVHSEAIKDLELDSVSVAKEQFLDDNDNFKEVEGDWFFYEGDEVFDLVTKDVNCDGDCVVEYIREYDDREVNVAELGLEDKDDRKVELSTVIRVKVFTDEDDNDEYFFDKVYIDSTVTSDDGELEAEVKYSLSL